MSAIYTSDYNKLNNPFLNWLSKNEIYHEPHKSGEEGQIIVYVTTDQNADNRARTFLEKRGIKFKSHYNFNYKWLAVTLEQSLEVLK